MDKEHVLKEIKNLVGQGELTKNEVLEAVGAGPHEAEPRTLHLPKISELLSYIGGVIVFLGIAILIAQNWTTLPSGAKILATLGLGAAAFVAGVLLSREAGRVGNIGTAFHVVAAFVLPLGLFVTFDIAGFSVAASGAQSVMTVILTAVYAAAYFTFRKNLFLLFSFIFGTWLFFVFTNLLIEGSQLARSADFYQYRVLFVGLAYLLVGYRFQQGVERTLSGTFYTIGIIAFLGAAMVLGGYEPARNVFWEILFPFLALGAILGSVYVKSKSVLAFGALFLIGYIIKITAEYFSDTLGWPLALVIIGFVIIGIGYLAFYVNRQYIEKGKGLPRL